MYKSSATRMLWNKAAAAEMVMRICVTVYLHSLAL